MADRFRWNSTGQPPPANTLALLLLKLQGMVIPFLERVGLVAMRSRKREIGNLKPRVVSVPYAILPPRPGQRRRIYLPVRGAGYELAILSKSIRLS
jgi:hypothetical protein